MGEQSAADPTKPENASRPRKPRSTLPFKLALAASSLILVFALAEGILTLTAGQRRLEFRVSGVNRLDPELIYSLRPQAQRRAWNTANQMDELAVINEYGLRDDEIRAKGAATRIVVTGDSQVYGHGLNGDETLPNRLEAIYAAAGRPAEVINAGVQGYGTDQSHKLFSLRLRRLDPDVLVFAVNVNDLRNNIEQPLYDIADGRLVELDPTRHALYVLQSVKEKLPGFLASSQLYALVWKTFRARDPFGQLPDLSEPELQAWAERKVVLAIEDLARMAAEDGFRLLVIGIPEKGAAPADYRYLRDALGQRVPFVDFTENESWRDEDRWYFRGDTHLNDAGARLLAELLYRTLEE